MFYVATHHCDGEKCLGDRGLTREFGVRLRDTKDVQLRKRESRLRRGLRIIPSKRPYEEHAPGNYEIHGDGVLERGVGFELELLDLAPCLDGLEPLFDQPPGAVSLNDREGVFRGSNGLGGVERPIDGLDTLGRCLLYTSDAADE